MNPPYDYQAINEYNGYINPSTVHCKNTVLTYMFYRYLLQKAISVAKWELPKNWNRKYFLYSLFIYGSLAIIKTDKFGVIPQQCGLGGLNVFYQPNKAIITNPLLRGIVEPIIDEQCVLFTCTEDYSGISDLVMYYAEQMAIASEALIMNNMNSKLAYAFSARNKAQAESLKKLLDKIMMGELGVFYDEKLKQKGYNDELIEPWKTFTNNLSQNYIAGDVIDNLRRIEELFCNDIGLPTPRSDKKERQVVSETTGNILESQSRYMMWLDGWKESCLKVKDMFDVDVSVNLRFKRGDIIGNTNSNGDVSI